MQTAVRVVEKQPEGEERPVSLVLVESLPPGLDETRERGIRLISLPLNQEPSLLGDHLEARRAELRATLPIGRVVGPADVAAAAVQLMANTAITGASVDVDGGQKLV